MPRRRKHKGKGIIDKVKKVYNYSKEKLWNINDYLKAKQFAKNIITDQVGWHNPIRAISQGYNINKYLQNSLFNAPLQFLSSKGYGSKIRRKKKNN